MALGHLALGIDGVKLGWGRPAPGNDPFTGGAHVSFPTTSKASCPAVPASALDTAQGRQNPIPTWASAQPGPAGPIRHDFPQITQRTRWPRCSQGCFSVGLVQSSGGHWPAARGALGAVAPPLPALAPAHGPAAWHGLHKCPACRATQSRAVCWRWMRPRVPR